MNPSQRPQVVQGVVLAASLDPMFDLRALSQYTSISVRQLRAYIALPTDALPCHRFGVKIAVLKSDWHKWAAQYRRVGVSVESRIERRAQQRRARLRRAPAA